MISERQQRTATLAASTSGNGAQGETKEGGSLMVQHLRPPAAYVGANWPLIQAAVSCDGMDVAVAGTRGLALYSRRSSRWRLFGDISQEREVAVQVRMYACPALAAGAQCTVRLPGDGKKKASFNASKVHRQPLHP